MKLLYITEALTSFIKKCHSNIEGFAIGRERLEPTEINAYKAYIIEIYWHTKKENKLIFTLKMVDRCLSGQEKALKEKYCTVLLEQLFSNLNNIENEIIQT